MFPKRPLQAAMCVFLFVGLTACSPGQLAEDSQAELVVSVSDLRGVSGYLPTGYYWKPGSRVEISIWQEPDGPGSASTQWKKILDVDVDATGMFGFNAGAPFYAVRRSICGTPEPHQTVVIMAKSVSTGTIRMRHAPADLYFTFQPCG